ncbi:flagellar hook protein FlgE [Sulfurimonas autotrophica]|uniref:Flagellar hook protein FlgE n=1 Tax=Sulfurimonas autotrophica (strain ATCC BAA-671 / DSM 16294 / JCM 11897 / OK10) TaxID=563040 RepID=E0USR5_SULAO|nr:flagellar hook protein FlgE [Sulfurimonas autotrophica]ADN08092.1 flagellar hook protein FlgE [Sulfurimonas autotrophica DSM 16294]
MLKSLFSGVSGLQSHQVAMDVESNNIANVNTVGFKYSRANFSDLLAQTKAIATAPQGQLGGKNPVQVGLGSTVSSMTRIFSQGSIQNSDKNTDVAIQGDGFFIISPDGGNTYKYTRAGDFKFDAGGNFVDNNGFIAQGWLRDPVTGKVDSTAPIENINIAPGLTTPAQPTQEVVLKANLNSGAIVESFSPAYQVPTGAPTDPALPAIDGNGNPIESGNVGVMFNESGEAFSLQDGQGVWASFISSTSTSTNSAQGSDTALAADEAETIVFNLDPGSSPATATASYTILAANTAAQNASVTAAAINALTATTGITATIDSSNKIVLTNTNGNSSASHNIDIASVTGANNPFDASEDDTTAYKYSYNSASPTVVAGSNKEFTTIADLRQALENQANSEAGATGIKVIVNDQGKIELSNTDSGSIDLNFKVTGISGSGITENTRFTRNMEALNTVLAAGTTGKAFSQAFNAATHSSSIDIFDSLGSKHTLRMEFRKTALDTTTGSTWSIVITVPEPATIDTIAPTYEKKGSIRFNNDGSLATYNPPNVSFSGNNGSAPDQQVNLSFGTANKFDGMTSFDSRSATSGISQDGYTGGDLVGIRIDQSGTLVGSFSNGRSFGLAQIGMAKFTNNEGLSTEGGNVYVQTANSGDPIIGTAATAGRGFIQSAALEASNVDLSRALTQLIIIQRGFQANGKTITTSDQLLQTLIGLKQ